MNVHQHNYTLQIIYNATTMTIHTQWQCTRYGVAPAMTTSSSSQDDTTQTYPDSLPGISICFIVKSNFFSEPVPQLRDSWDTSCAIRFFSEPVPQLRDSWDNTWCYRKPRRYRFPPCKASNLKSNWWYTIEICWLHTIACSVGPDHFALVCFTVSVQIHRYFGSDGNLFRLTPSLVVLLQLATIHLDSIYKKIF